MNRFRFRWVALAAISVGSAACFATGCIFPPDPEVTGSGGSGGSGSGGSGAAGGSTSTATSSGGNGGAGGDAGGGGGGPVLDDTLLIARYHIDEHASGLPAPSELIDVKPLAFNLPIDAVGAMTSDFSFVEEGGHRGLRWAQAAPDARARGQIADTLNKVFVALDGNTAATLEAVIRVDSTVDQGGAILSISRFGGNQDEYFSLYARKSGGIEGLELQWDGSSAAASTIAGAWNAPLAQRAVVHLVLDTTQTASADRVRLYLDGTERADRTDSVTGAAPTTVTDPEQNETIALSSGMDRYLVLGNRTAGARSPAGVIFYAALYSEAFMPARVTAHAAALGTVDDMAQ